MFLTKFIKFCLLVALFASACRFWQPKSDATAQPTPAAIEEVKSDVPFATKEPTVFQTEIVVTANGVENVIFAARDGENHLTIYDYQKKSEFSLLQTDGGGSFTIARDQKIYVENKTTGDFETTDDFPSAELLNEKPDATYESLEAENGFAKYRIILNDAKNSEIVVTVDQNIDLPVKQEFYSVSGEQKTLLSTTELRNFKRQPDARNFELPKDFKKISPKEFWETVRREKLK